MLCNTSHYLIKLLHFVHESLDQRKSNAALAAAFDLSKAFNRIDHSLVISDLCDMHTPAWLLNLVVSNLGQKTMTLKYSGAESSLRTLPAGTPQGAYLGGLIFIIKFNGAFLRPPIPRPISYGDSSALKVKYIDDGTVAVNVSLKSCLINDPVSRPRPLSFEERSGHVLPPQNNLLQYYVYDTEGFAAENNLMINKKKSKLIEFSNSRKLDFPPEITFRDGSLLESTTEMTLLGVIVSNDLKWAKNTEFICTKARQKLWILRRMLKLKLTEYELFDVYQKEVRTILEFAVPVWHSALTRKQTSEIESIQKQAFKIILGKSFYSYSDACAKFSTGSLEQRRLEICHRFALKNLDSNQSLFTRVDLHPGLRKRSRIVTEYKCNKRKFQRSSLPYLASLLNSRC